MKDNLITRRNESVRKLEQNILQRRKQKVSFIEKVFNNLPFPFMYSALFRICGAKIGKNVKFLGKIKVKIKGSFKNIEILDNVLISANVDFRNRENGKIILKEGVYLDEGVRLVAARNGSITIGRGTEVGSGTVFNSGGTTNIGNHCMLASFVNINSSSHGIIKSQYIKEQNHIHGIVNVGDDVWIGSYSTILMDSIVGNGAVIGSHSVVKGEVKDFAVAVGVPARQIKIRT